VPPSILKTEFPLLKYTLPEATASFLGCPIDVLKAAAGVGGGAPPATVDIVYCCAYAAGLTASHRVQHNLTTGLGILGFNPVGSIQTDK
jgi:hypothetical protein